MVVLIHGHCCGCYYTLRPDNTWSYPHRVYIPPVNISSHTTILSTTSRTVLRQTFQNPSKVKGIREVRYTFPMFDGVSVVGFKCDVQDRTIIGEVKEKATARKEYEEAKDRGEVAGLLEQLPEASDVFTTTLANVPPDAKVYVEITYLGELKHDAEADGARFTIPTVIAPRYGEYPGRIASSDNEVATNALWSGGKFEATVDVMLENGAFIREVRSPSHPISVQNGIISTASEADPAMNKASVSLALGTAALEKDFVLQIVAKDFARPAAILETHPKYPNHKALMTTLVPKFELKHERPEIVFICDRSGSMDGGRIEALKRALETFLKSLPVGVVFNICSFGSSHSFLWPSSQPYDEKNLKHAIKHVKDFRADYGGTQMVEPVLDTLNKRHKDRNLEAFLVTDGEIWDQQTLFDHLNERIGKKKEPARIFTLGIGDQVSTSLIEGVARAGNGFSQAVGENEKMDAKVVRMLKGALLPHINDYKLEINVIGADGEDKTIDASAAVVVDVPAEETAKGGNVLKKISLFNEQANPDAPVAKDKELADKITPKEPTILQAPSEIPALFPFMRRTVYLLLPDLTGEIKSVTLSGTCKQGPLSLDIPVTVLETPGETIHQLAAKGAVQELEEGRGWVYAAKVKGYKTLLREEYPSVVSELARREAVRLGVKFQVGGKNCSFVAVEKKKVDVTDKAGDKDAGDVTMEDEYEFIDDDLDALTLSDNSEPSPGGFQQQSAMPISGRVKSTARKSTGLSHSLGSSFGGMAQNVRMMMSKAAPSPSFGGAPAPRMAMMSMAAPSPSFGNAAPPPPAAAYGRPGPGAAMSQMSMSPFSTASAPVTAPAASYRHRKVAVPDVAESRKRGKPRKLKKGSDPSSSSASASFEHADGAARPGGPPPAPRAMPKPSGSRFPNVLRRKSEKSAAAGPDPEDLIDYSDEDMDDDGISKEEESAADASSSASGEATLRHIISLQSFSGSWTWSPALLRAIGVDAGDDTVKQALAAAGADKNALATVLAVRFLELKMAADKGMWELVVDKARAWVEGEGKEELFDVANKIIV